MKHENIADIYKLTPIQQGILFHSLYTPQSGVYFEQFSWTVNQEWIVPVFERAWQYVVDQHPILRTAFFWEDLDEPIQVVQRQAQIPFINLDWSDLSPAEQEARLETYLQHDREQGFDLTEAPLTRVTMIRGGAETFHFVWSYHHLLLDGWSVPLIIQDVFTAYSAFAQGQQPRLARRRPYRDYLAWLRKKDLGEAERYWRPILEGFTTPTPLPFDHSAGRVAADGYEKSQIEIAPEQAEALQALARRERLTLSTLVHGAWALLLQGYSGGDDLVFGTTVSGRPADLAGSETMVGCFINTLPMRVQMRPEQTLRDWLTALQQQQVATRQYAYSPLVEVQRWSDLPPGERLFESIVVFENYPSEALSEADLRIFQKTNYPLTLVAVPRTTLNLRISYETQHFDAATIERLLAQLQTLLESMAERLDRPVSEVTLLSADERNRLLVEWNATAAPYAQDACLHTLIERQVEQTPNAIAVAFEEQQLSYAELNARANQLAHHLRSLGVGPEQRVAICMKRSADLLVGLLAILKAGGAYVPLDPNYPAARLAFMLQDSAPTVLLTESRVTGQLPSTEAHVVLLDRAGEVLAAQPATNLSAAIAPEQIAYMIYTSGSTGRPKGVMVPHGPVVNFLTAMQSQIGCGTEDALLATTSISFDISVLELFWPLTQGAKVVILAEHAASGMPTQAESARSDRAIDFSLFYFASDDSGANGDKYRLLIEGAKFADQHGFTAVWTPERHFHEFGGLYPNPAITSAALATITHNVQLRAGSVVMPLHDPIRVAEEWSVVDNISKGRVGIAFASGWHANDFVFFPERYRDRKQATADGLAAVQKLWRGESLTVQSGAGDPIDVRIFPKPVQPELPIWITAAGNPETFIEAGRSGANILTHLLGQSLEDVAEKVRLYRAARAESGLDPETGQVTLMLHTFIGEDRDSVRETVRQPFTNYLRSSAGLIANLAKSVNIGGDINSLSQTDMDALLALAFDRYFETSALFGTVESCAEMVERLKAIGVDEIGCLVDFGVQAEQALAALEQLNRLRELTSPPAAKAGASLPLQAQKHNATLLQGTPSLAKLLLLQPDTLPALRSLRALLLGGEALPTALAQQLLPLLSGRLINMYGPTETTIWSATHPVTDVSESNVPIGTPIANTEIYLLDTRLQPTPIGVPGELYIGGMGVTRGYYQHPALTAERYLPDPFGSRPGGRIYKTGDLARYRQDGTIEFLGRVDFQVKLRGFRIELGEIETVLTQHPAIREAVVVARQETADTRLVAYVVEQENKETREQSTADSPSPVATEAEARRGSGKGAGDEGLLSSLRNFIKARLPEYMVPSAFVFLDALPLTPNGKVDRKALPAPDAGLAALEPSAAQPRTPTEEVVASLWEGVLGVQHVGVHDNFFMLGGHSLLATQILSRVRETFQVDLALSTLFNTPTVAGMAQQVELAQQKASGLQAPPIEPVSRDRPLPLSFAQQRIWFLQQVDPDSATYNNPTAVGLKGALDLAAMTQTLNTIVERHEILRTTFPMIDARPVQQIRPHLTLELPLIDLSDRSNEEQQTELRRIGTLEAQRLFDLANGPLIRALIFKHSDQEHTLLVTMHHIVSDGWSLGVLIREMAVLYTSLSSQSQLHPEATRRALPELPIQYVDYAAWQRSWLQGEVLEQQQAYWKQQLSGNIPALNLPTDHPRPPVRTYRGAKQSLHFPRPLLDGLNQLSRSAGTTLFMTLMSGLNALLYRYSGQTDLVIGSPIANRHHGQVEDLIGCFINTLVLRSDLSGNPTFTELLGRSREVALGAYAHQDLPFEQVVEIAEYEADISRHPLFQVFFILQNTPMNSVSLGDLTLSTVDITTETAKFDLAFELIETDIGIIGSVEYNTDIFEATTIQRMIGHFERLLEYCVAQPEQRLGDLAFLAETERQQLLVEWNATTVDYPRDVCLHTLIERQVERTPDATALVFENDALSYAALNARANQLAHHLQSLGVGAEDLVGVCVERSPEMLIALLGILKAGAAYVPLDPAYPQDRLAYMLDDAQMRVLLTQERLLAQLPEHGATTICLDADWSQIATRSSHNPASRTSDDTIAYVIYTSGSTGRPKGVPIPHRAVVNFLRSMEQQPSLSASDTLVAVTTLAFDIAGLELFLPLITGARVVLARRDETVDGQALAALLRDADATVMQATPVTWRGLLESGWSPPRGFKLLCGGEALPLDLAQRLSAGDGELWNLYGPTETTIWSTVARVAPQPTQISIGRPIANTTIYLLDPQMHPVPVGVPGRLYIGGDGLARGYLGRPALTAERFVPDPFSPTPGARLYWTGDLARYRPDGRIEHLGRVDYQVKLRGFRIELGEIETALGQHPQVREVVVLARQDAPGDTRLVAYLVPQGDAALTVGELRRFLEPTLPEYMIPATFVLLDALPLTPNGKVDRRALPAPDSARPELEAAYIAPRTETEQALAEIWKQVLGVEQVGIHDSFFELGGDSILSFQIIARAGEAGMYLTPNQLFQHRTIAALSGFVSAKQRVEAEQRLVTGEVVLTPIQQWFFEQQFTQPQHWNQAVLLDLAQPLDPALLTQTVQHLVAHHDALRLRFSHNADGWHQTNASVEDHALVTYIDLSDLPAAEQSTALTARAAELHASLDLADGPLLRVATFDLGPQGTRLLLVVHHLAVDGVSWRILLDDLHTVYQQLERGEQPTLPAKTTSFQHWAARLHEFAQAPELRAEAQSWLDRPWQQIPALPLDRSADGEANVESAARIASVTLSADETRALLQDVPQAYNVQINDLLLAALAEAFARWTGERTILVDLEGHGREDLFPDVDVSRTVGWFTSLFPVVLDLRKTNGPDGLIKRVKEQLRQIPRRGIGYGLLRYLSDDAEVRSRLAALPRAEVLFNYLGQLDQALPEDSPFALAGGDSGPAHSPRNQRTHLLEINSFVAGGSLRIDWTYSEQHHDRATIEGVAQDCLRALKSLIAYCLTSETRGYTPSDFPLAAVDQSQLDWIGREHAIADLYPLASVQQGMLFHTLSAPASGVYVQQLTCDLRGDLDVAAFYSAWQHVVDQHAILRTGFLWEQVAQPLQVVQPQAAIPFTQLDWRDHSAAEQEQQFAAYLQTDREQGFDLLTPPLLRLALIQTGDTAYRFLWSYHHIVLDGWSMPLIFRQVLSAYHAFRTNREAQSETSRPYRDYIAWLQRQDLDAAESFWRSTLEGFSAPTPLTVDRPFGGESGAESAYGEQTLALSRATTEALHTLARRHHLTINTLVQGAWALLLHRYSGEHDIVFGAATSGRPPELTSSETMIGLFINTLPVRVEARPEAGLIPWLQQLQAHQVEMRQFEYTPLAQIQSWSSIPRGQSLFESILVFENYPMDELLQEQQGSLQFGLPHMIEQTNYPLTIVAVQEPVIKFTMSYDTRRFDDTTIARVQQHLHTLLEAMIAGPAQSLDELTVISQAERQRLLVEWNATTVDYPRDVCLHTLIERQVERTPDATALVFEDRALSYADLNARANQLAHHLRDLGVGPDVLVALMVERSLDMIVGMLAILKAGGAYVPLDPAYPQDRIAYMLEDAGTSLVLTQQHLDAHLPPHTARVLRLDADWPQIAQQPSSNPTPLADATNLAYMIYTSGSTGRPKGVPIPHRAVVNFLCSMAQQPGLSAGDTLVAVTTLAFDIAGLELFLPLITGARVVLARRDETVDGQALAALLRDADATVMQATPVTWRGLLESGWSPPRGFKLLCGGEALPLDLAQRLSTGDGELWNLYGPTETTIWSTVERVAPQPTQISIGRPIANTTIYLLDPQMHPVPVGVPGRLYIGGDGLARGYLGRPALTAERFVPDPFSPTPGARLYWTGDLARYRPDGRIEHLGRVDFQVKLRGFRIELGEIETALGQHPQIREVVVLAREDAPGDTRLVAYLVPQGDAALTVGELRRFLEPTLPEYMIPATFVLLDALPLTPNGKVDRRALPAPDSARPELEAAYIAPQTEVEQALAEIWKQVLGVEQVGIHDSFMELGGDSILSLQVVARTNEAGLRLTPAQLFQHRTIAELAAVVGANQPIQAEQGLVTGEVVLTPIQQWFFEQQFAQPQHWNQAVLLEPAQPLDPALLTQTVQHLVAHHDALRLRFSHNADDWHQTNASVEDHALVTYIDLSDLPAAEQSAALTARAAELHASLDLADGPLLRVATFDLGPQGTRLLLVVHHLAVDGVSWRILLDDLHTVYQQLERGEQPTLPAKATSFQHWAARLHEFAQAPELRAEAQSWLDRPWQQIPALPRDRTSGKNVESATRTVTVKLSSTLTHSLLHDAHQAYNTQINDLLLTALAETLADWTKARTVLLNLEGHGREDLFPDVDVSRTVGWFTSLFPVVLDLRQAHAPGAVITAVKEQLRDLPNHGVGYGILRYLSQDAALREQLGRLPQGEITFNYVGQLDQALLATTPFRFAAEGSGPTHSPQAERAYLLEVNAAIVGGRLQVEWSYSDQIYDRATIETLAETYLDMLHELIEHALSPEAGAYTPSDFAEFAWSQDSLDNITDIIRKSIGDL